MKNDTGEKMRYTSYNIRIFARNYSFLKIKLHFQTKLCDCVHIAHSHSQSQSTTTVSQSIDDTKTQHIASAHSVRVRV